MIVAKHGQAIELLDFSGHIYELGDRHVVKWPKLLPETPTNAGYNLMHCDMIIMEAEVYERLGQHEGVIQYFGIHDADTGAMKLAYADQGDLSTYILDYPQPSRKDLVGWI